MRALYPGSGLGPRRYTAPVAVAPFAALLAWFERNARALPWRGPLPRDPYPVLLSEVMAQQTQLDRVVAAYLGFLERFPTVAALAAAPEDDVVAAFAGLGYYRRARLLHRAAQELQRRGSWPRDAASLARLPGVGPYTAAAVATFCFAGTAPPVDGNVMRVAARVGALALPLGSAQLARQARAWASSLWHETKTPRVFEAVMELGALVCTPVSPACPECPLQPCCRAGTEGDVQHYPAPRPARTTQPHCWVVVWAQQGDGRVLLRRVESGPILRGLWLPPFHQLQATEDGATVAASLVGELGLGVLALRPGPAVSHSITHRAIKAWPFVADVPAGTAEALPNLVWRCPEDSGVPTSSLLVKLARALARERTPKPSQDRC